MDRKINEIARKLRVKFKDAYIFFDVQYNYHSTDNFNKIIRLYINTYIFKSTNSSHTNWYKDINELIELVNSEFNLKINKVK